MNLNAAITPDPDNGGQVSWYKDATRGSCTTWARTVQTPVLCQDDLYINTRGGTSQLHANYIAEVLIFKVGLSAAARQEVEGYLMWKWGLQTRLPTAHQGRSSFVVHTDEKASGDQTRYVQLISPSNLNILISFPLTTLITLTPLVT